jgi:Predicted HD superfamily hydrolase involved in NAD metabolism
MKIPSPTEAERLLSEAAELNPGAWVSHSEVAGNCAKIIARQAGLDENIAYSIGLLHDIGRRYGVTDMRHIYDGYTFLNELGYIDYSRVCLTHSFPLECKDIACYIGTNDCTDEENSFMKDFLTNTDYDDYDFLIQLCDALAYSDGACYVEKRLVDVSIRKGFNEFTIFKWQQYLALKDYFDNKCGTDIYKLIGV